MARTRIREIGNSRGVIIPTDMLRSLRIEDNADVEMTTDGRRIVISPARKGGDEEDFYEILDEVLKDNDKIIVELAKV